jgi:L-cysteine S-thiosulfotransferase
MRATMWKVGYPSAVRLLAICLIAGAGPLPFQVSGDRIDTPLSPDPGDPAAGRRIVLDRAVSACLLCHAGPFPAPHLQGSIGPDLTGVGSRLSAAQIRLRISDPAKLDPDTVMPSYYVKDGLNRVGQAWQGKTILTGQQIEDVVAFLATLRSP